MGFPLRTRSSSCWMRLFEEKRSMSGKPRDEASRGLGILFISEAISLSTMLRTPKFFFVKGVCEREGVCVCVLVDIGANCK